MHWTDVATLAESMTAVSIIVWLYRRSRHSEPGPDLGTCPELGKCLSVGASFGKCPRYSCDMTQSLTDAQRDACGCESPYDRGRQLAARTARFGADRA